MITRRQLISALGYLGVGSVFSKAAFAQSGYGKLSSTEENSLLPPHCEALSLVWSSQQNLIREIETKHAKEEQAKRKSYVSAESRWWFDIEGRNWEVSRPLAPGTLDSTHWFIVSYLIDGKTVAAWSVDTEKKKVTVSLPK